MNYRVKVDRNSSFLRSLLYAELFWNTFKSKGKSCDNPKLYSFL